ncbi:mitochondrial tRNA dimethylallyltransferase [Andalucia godoyi]|uniref:Mitochondrial tRNA dimethylallyltransferase n=1 Tax=Andalucia godoyi TaxID=505711 RepID=A0A8K0AHB1_ANDGO|nr:mitochondrial tRNA dimethylallyltransferase [Andalucia godoyi]|eukprot:ANDGO_02568.mRNA.1 mitochondrial tRNA dimethylallyltransferase
MYRLSRFLFAPLQSQKRMEDIRPHLHKCVFVVGPTASGKSAVAIQLAKVFDGEVVNCDAMQSYKGLDIVTNKASASDQQGIPHHLMSFIDPFATPYVPFDIRKFTDVAVATITDIIGRKKMPIVCGGTNYYVQSLLLKSSLVNESSENEEDDELLTAELDSRDSKSLYAELQRIDPIMAVKLHPNDKRKILRALQVFHKKGIPYSEILVQQESKGMGTFRPSNMRYDAMVLSVTAPRDVLNRRIDERVEQMFENGLLNEIRDFHKRLGQPEVFPNQGLLQSIGFKEFLPFLQSAESLGECKEAMKGRTRRYAIRQAHWIQHQFVNRGLPIFEIRSPWLSHEPEGYFGDITAAVNGFCATPSCYDSIYNNNSDIRGKLTNRTVKITPASGTALSRPQTTLTWKKVRCESCNITMNGENEWTVHLQSSKHKRQLRYLKEVVNRPSQAKKPRLQSNDSESTTAPATDTHGGL